MVSVTSVYTLSGDAKQTLNTLTNTVPSGSSDLASLSTTNYLIEGDTKPNPTNQVVFKNQPLSWWVSSLNSGIVKYTPVSNDVNWVYVDVNNNSIYISIEISNLLIPNRPQGVAKNPGSMSSQITFEPKFGITRVDTQIL